MFLFERLIGVGVYSALLVLVCVLIMQKNSPYRFVLFLYTICLAIMGFFYVPYITSDLYRINESMTLFAKYDWSEFYEEFVMDSSIPIARIYYWLIGRSGELRLLPAINAFVVYSCIFYIITRTAKIYNISNKNIASAVLFFMAVGNYMFVITGIRSMLGVALIGFCFFREAVEKKHNILHIPLYIVAALVHNFTLVLLMIRLAVSIFSKSITALKRFLYIIFVFIMFIVFFKYGSFFVESALDKAESYVSYDHYSYFWEYMLGVLSIIFVIVAMVMLSKAKKQIKRILFVSNFFAYSCILLACVFCFEFSIFHRMTTYMIPVLILPTYMIALQISEKGERRVSNYRYIMNCYSLFMLLISCSRGTLCSLKFFEL